MVLKTAPLKHLWFSALEGTNCLQLSPTILRHTAMVDLRMTRFYLCTGDFGYGRDP